MPGCGGSEGLFFSFKPSRLRKRGDERRKRQQAQQQHPPVANLLSRPRIALNVF